MENLQEIARRVLDNQKKRDGRQYRHTEKCLINQTKTSPECTCDNALVTSIKKAERQAFEWGWHICNVGLSLEQALNRFDNEINKK